MRDIQGHAEPLFVFRHALMGPGKRSRAFLNAALQLEVGSLECLLCLDALGDFPLQRIVHFDERPRLLIRVDEDVDLRPQDSAS